jgi:hypothetical protein
MWDLWWTKWHWGRFSPATSISPAKSHSTDCSTFIIINHPGLVQQAKQRPTYQVDSVSPHPKKLIQKKTALQLYFVNDSWELGVRHYSWLQATVWETMTSGVRIWLWQGLAYRIPPERLVSAYENVMTFAIIPRLFADDRNARGDSRSTNRISIHCRAVCNISKHFYVTKESANLYVIWLNSIFFSVDSYNVRNKLGFP